ncbi:MAG: hypothetical protein ABIF71_15850 [Planctomycetota bacterium]
MLMALTIIKATLYKHANGVYPVSFHALFKNGEYPYLCIDDNGRRMTNRGCEVVFVEEMADGSSYKTDADRAEHVAFYATPLEYGLTGETTYIVNETGLILSNDFGASSKIVRWPADEKLEYWQLYK